MGQAAGIVVLALVGLATCAEAFDSKTAKKNGYAVDLILVGEKGQPLDMGCAFDFFGNKGQPRCSLNPNDVPKM
jgi:D-alanyl-D-alanine dipeptidase